MLKKLQDSAIQNKNIFSVLMEVSKVCSLGEDYRKSILKLVVNIEEICRNYFYHKIYF